MAKYRKRKLVRSSKNPFRKRKGMKKRNGYKNKTKIYVPLSQQAPFPDEYTCWINTAIANSDLGSSTGTGFSAEMQLINSIYNAGYYTKYNVGITTIVPTRGLTGNTATSGQYGTIPLSALYKAYEVITQKYVIDVTNIATSTTQIKPFKVFWAPFAPSTLTIPSTIIADDFPKVKSRFLAPDNIGNGSKAYLRIKQTLNMNQFFNEGALQGDTRFLAATLSDPTLKCGLWIKIVEESNTTGAGPVAIEFTGNIYSKVRFFNRAVL